MTYCRINLSSVESTSILVDLLTPSLHARRRLCWKIPPGQERIEAALTLRLTSLRTESIYFLRHDGPRKHWAEAFFLPFFLFFLLSFYHAMMGGDDHDV